MTEKLFYDRVMIFLRIQFGEENWAEERGGGSMKRTRRHDIEGAILDVPLRYDARAQMDIEEYPDLIKYPLYTPAGERVMLTIEDACDLGETADGVQCIDCGSCVYYRQAPDSLLGVCAHAKHRCG